VVTGATRGIGKGIATVLGERGATVYVTGRTTAVTPNATSGTINSGTISEVAEVITAAGGVGIAVRCDHADDAHVKALLEGVKAEQGHLISWSTMQPHSGRILLPRRRSGKRAW